LTAGSNLSIIERQALIRIVDLRETEAAAFFGTVTLQRDRVSFVRSSIT